MAGIEIELWSNFLSLLRDNAPTFHILWKIALLVYGTYALYGCVMNLKRVRNSGGLTMEMKILGYPLVAAAAIADVLFNFIIGTIMFAEVPPARHLTLPTLWTRTGLRMWVIRTMLSVEWLFTWRLIRHKKLGGWRGRMASWCCSDILDRLDSTGCHCSEDQGDQALVKFSPWSMK